MTTLEQLKTVLFPENAIVFVNEIAVWDYKAIGNKLYLISEKSEDILDTIPAQELLEFCKEVWQDTEEIEVICEHTQQELTQVERTGALINFKQK